MKAWKCKASVTGGLQVGQMSFVVRDDGLLDPQPDEAHAKLLASIPSFEQVEVDADNAPKPYAPPPSEDGKALAALQAKHAELQAEMAQARKASEGLKADLDKARKELGQAQGEALDLAAENKKLKAELAKATEADDSQDSAAKSRRGRKPADQEK